MRHLISIGLFALGAVASAQFSTFEVGTEGWTITGTGGGYGLPPGGATIPSLAAGNPGQGIFTNDVYGETFFAAPTSFLGNKSAFFGTNFVYQEKISYTDGVTYPALILMGPSNVGLWCNLASPVVGVWTQRSIPLVGASFRKTSWTGPVATDADVQAVLANLQGLYVNAEWMTGPDATTLDNVGFEGALTTLSGTVGLNDWIATRAGQVVRIDLLQNANTVASIPNVVLNSDGGFTAATSFQGTCQIAIRGSHWLRKKVLGTFVLVGPGLSGVNATLTNGDVDASGEVDAVDIDLVIAEFGSTATTDADVDGSQEVDAVDIDIVIANFGAVDE